MIGSLIKTMADAQKLSIQQIVKGVQMGSIPAYVGIPLIEKKTKEAQKLQMAQAALREQGEPQTTVGDQVMQAAGQVTRPENPLTPTSLATGRQRPAPYMGIDSADSNMPQEYAGGGIVAFADQGLVNLDDSGLQEPIPGTTKRVQVEDDGAITRAKSISDKLRPYNFLGPLYESTYDYFKKPATNEQYVNDPSLGMNTPIWDMDALKRRRFFKSLADEAPKARPQGPAAPLPNADLHFKDAQPLPNAR